MRAGKLDCVQVNYTIGERAAGRTFLPDAAMRGRIAAAIAAA